MSVRVIFHSETEKNCIENRLKKIMKIYYVYILACSDKSNYVGITSSLSYRIFQHQSGFYPDSYTSLRRSVVLRYYAEFTDVGLAIDYEKQIKKVQVSKLSSEVGSFDLTNKTIFPNFTLEKSHC